MVAAVSNQNTQLHPALHPLLPEEDPNTTATSQTNGNQQVSPVLTPPPIVNRHALALFQHGPNAKLPAVTKSKPAAITSPPTKPPTTHSVPSQSGNSGFFGWIKSTASAVTSTVSSVVHNAVNNQRATDARMTQIGGAIDSGVNWAEHKVDNARAWLRQNAGVAGQMASDTIGYNEGATLSLYGMGKGIVQMAAGAQALTNPVEWMANPQGNIDRIKSTVNTGMAVGKIASLADPVSWITHTQGNSQLASALWNSGVTSFQSDPSKFLGNATMTVATLFIPGGGEVGAAADVAKVADTAADVTKVVDTAQDASKVVNTAQDATKAVNTVQDTTRVGSTAQDAANATVKSAQDAANATVKSAQDAANATVKSAQDAANATVMSAQDAANATVQLAQDTAQTTINVAQDAARNATKLPPGTIFSGHGSYSLADGTTSIPPGTSLTVYAQHGAPITNSLGNAIETGADLSKVFKTTFGPRSEIPNYTLHPPGALSLQGNPTTVNNATRLSDLLQPGMGDCHWAACLSDRTAPGARLVYDTTGIFEGNSWKPITIYRH